MLVGSIKSLDKNNPMNSEVIVHLKGISKTYKKGSAAIKATNLSIATTEIVGIVGANGSGKSTLLKMIAGSITPSQGEIDIFQLDALTNTEQLKKLISYISQDRALDPEMTGKELLYYFSALYGLSGKTAEQKYTELVDTFELTLFIERRVNSYSGGQAQRLHLALGVIHQPKLLLLDEPTSALDPRGKSFFWQFIRRYQQAGNTIMIVSHELDKVCQFCSRILLIDKGKIIADDTPESIIQAHAAPTLFIQSASHLIQKEALQQNLQEKISPVKIEFKGAIAQLEIDQNTALSQSEILALALQVFQDQQQPVIECRWQAPGLENAYFKLTGEKITPPSASKNNKKGRRKGL